MKFFWFRKKFEVRFIIFICLERTDFHTRNANDLPQEVLQGKILAFNST
jgi:hypothetical protein